jgi:hypothetical protein
VEPAAWVRLVAEKLLRLVCPARVLGSVWVPRAVRVLLVRSAAGVEDGESVRVVRGEERETLLVMVDFLIRRR